MRLSFNGEIAGNDYDKKATELKERQLELVTRIEQHQKGEGEFRATLDSLISVVSRTADSFERSKVEQKRQLIAFVFSNMSLREKPKLSLRSPFDLMVNRASHASWLAFLDTVRTERFDQILTLGPRVPGLVLVA